jgi:hypothetical protein
MFVREYVQTCAGCREVTPHSRRIVAWVWIAAGACAIGVAWCLFQGAAGRVPAAALALVGLCLLLRDRDRCWRVRCERCRWKKVAAIRRTGPTLDGRTEIFLG